MANDFHNILTLNPSELIKWCKERKKEKGLSNADIAEKQEQIQSLQTEQNQIKEHICEIQEDERKLTEDLGQIRRQLVLFERLLVKLQEECSLERELHIAERKLRDLTYQKFQMSEKSLSPYGDTVTTSSASSFSRSSFDCSNFMT